MKSGYYELQINEENKYKIIFIVSFDHCKWNVMPMDLKSGPSESQTSLRKDFPYHLKNKIYQ